MRKLIVLLAVLIACVRLTAQTWPLNAAKYMVDVQKTAGQEMTDPYWAHLMMPGQTVTLGVHIDEATGGNAIDLSTVTVQMRYAVHGVPVSPWLTQPFAYTLDIANAALPSEDGVHDISIQVQGTGLENYRPRPMFLHLYRGVPHVLSPLVPVMSRDNSGYQKNGYDYGGSVVYVNYADTHFQGYRVDPSVTPWTESPLTANLYQEEMSPHVDLFMSTQMWWEQAAPPNQGEKFARALVSKTSEEVDVLWQEGMEVRRPILDGSRGIGWIGSYIAGQIDSAGGLAFVEFGGTVRYLAPNGDVTTVAGYRVKPNRYPIWWQKPLDVVRQNMELRGTWTSGAYPFPDPPMKAPLDLAIDPRNEKVWYVPGYFDNCIWKVDATAGFGAASVSVFAGDPAHSNGLLDGSGTAARFDEPASIVFDPVCDCLYVADQGNDAIRKITRAGVVSTPFSHPHMQQDLAAKGLTLTPEAQYTYQNAARGLSHYTVTAAQASSGMKPDIFVPQTVRVDSTGKLLVNDVGFGGVRKIDPATGVTTQIANLYQRFIPNSIGWAWFDVDRWGHAGPKDGVYTCVFQGSQPDGETVPHTNEFYAWVPADGSAPGHFIFNDFEGNPDGLGPRAQTDPPHYCWMLAVDPRGALLMAGGGEHGVTRLRMRKATGDPDVPPGYGDAENIWNGKVFLGGTLTYGPPPALKFGMLGHNYLGFANSWGMASATDAQWTSAFELPAEITSDATKYAKTLNYLKFAAGVGASTTPPIPPDPIPIPPNPPAGSGTWTRQGADAGMTKYTTPAIPTSVPLLTYRKRFYDAWAAQTGNYFYGQNLVVRDGQAVVMASDAPSTTLKATKFDFGTGATLASWTQPFPLSQDALELDGWHFSGQVIWHDNGLIYTKRGGDNNALYSLDPSSGIWTGIPSNPDPCCNAFSGDAVNWIQLYGSQIVHRYGDARNKMFVDAYDLAGNRISSLGPDAPLTSDMRWVYGDMPKVAQGISMLAASVGGNQLYLQAVRTSDGANLWTKTLPSDAGGQRGLQSGVSDYWRFVLTEGGRAVIFTKSGGCVVRVLDLASGNELWTRTLTDATDRPLFATHGSDLYIIGKSQQLKVNIDTGAVAWTQAGSYGIDNYIHQNYSVNQAPSSYDPLYKPVVLTDSSLWFISGSAPNAGTLVGLNTASGAVIASVDVAAQIRSTAGETLEYVNDLMAAGGSLGVLVTVRSTADSHVPALPFQDVLVYGFGTTPPPPTDNIPPTITPNVPITGVVGTPVPISATASDNVAVTGGTVTLPGQGSAAAIIYPYSSQWTPQTAGTQTITFTATDAAGNPASVTSTITVTTGNVPPPTVLPLTVSSVTTSCRMTVTDPNGPPDATGGWSVQFKRGTGTNVGNKVTAPPWQSSTTLGPGTYQFFAVWTKSGAGSVTRPAVAGVCQ